jgi:hypothetical protein
MKILIENNFPLLAAFSGEARANSIIEAMLEPSIEGDGGIIGEKGIELLLLLDECSQRPSESILDGLLAFHYEKTFPINQIALSSGSSEASSIAS